MTQEARDLAVAEAPRGDLLPILDPKAAERAYHTYLKLCQAILVPYDKRIVKDGVVIQESDYARIPQRKQVDGKWITEYVDAPKKSAWRKLGRFYGVSTEIVEKTKEPHPDGSYTWHYTVKATAGGVSQDGEGSCTSTEKGGKSEHDTRATAHTRAKSRAISDLIGFGQVSAEEYSTHEDALPPKPVEATARVVDPHPHPARQKLDPETVAEAERRSKELLEDVANRRQAETPIVDSAEETVKATLIANDLDIDHLLIVRYGDVIRVEPKPGFPDKWADYDKMLKLLKAKWSDEELRWEIPAKNLEHLTDAPGPEPEEPVYDIWAIDWKLKGGESAPRGTSWAWAFAYNDGDYIPEIKPLVQFIEQYGQLEAEGYTVTLGGRDKSLLNLKKNKKAKA